MKMIRAIIRPEKADEVAKFLLDAGYPSMTRMDVYGRGKQKGIQVGGVFYDELPKHMFLIVVEDSDEESVVNIITKAAQTGSDGNYGDGRIFVTSIEKAFTISSMSEGL